MSTISLNASTTTETEILMQSVVKVLNK